MNKIQVEILELLNNLGSATASELSHKIQRHKQHTSHILKDLCNAGLIEKTIQIRGTRGGMKPYLYKLNPEAIKCLPELSTQKKEQEKILRKCIKCGLEARTRKDLELFAIASKNKFGRRNLCKKCFAREAREYRRRRWDDLGLCRQCGKPSDRNTAYCSKCLKKMRIYNRRRHWELRLGAILKLGGKCIICEIQDFRLLTINHKEGRNYRTTIDKGDKFYHNILNGKRNMDDLEVRCYNCNALYEFEMGYRKVPEILDLSIISQFEKEDEKGEM